jgi:hypothetical protein
MPGEGVLKFDVWPTFLGVAGQINGSDTVREPFGVPNYERGQIDWSANAAGEVVGKARVCLPAGVYTHYVFWAGPQQLSSVMGMTKLDEPVVFDRPGFLDVDPINH